MKRVERWIEIRNEGLGGEGGQQCLSISPEVGRNLGTLSDSNLLEKRGEPQSIKSVGIKIETPYVLHQTENQHRQHLHILTER
jgi:hypothetical protein